MRIRFILPALMVGAGLLLPTQPPAQAKTTTYKVKKYKKFKGSKKFKARKFKGSKVSKVHVVKHKTTKVRH